MTQINKEQTNNCFLGAFVICTNDAPTIVLLLGNPPEGSSTIDQYQLNECASSDDPADPTSCANTIVTELFLSASDLAFIESNSEQLTKQTNTCTAGASCENTGVLIGIDPIPKNEFISIVAEDQAIVKADTEKDTLQDNVCEGAITECINFGFDLIDISATDRAVVEANSQQFLEQGNECPNGVCVTGGQNVFAVSTSDQASVDSKADQDIEQGVECQDGICVDEGDNLVTVSELGKSSVDSKADQIIDTKNDCRGGVVCTNGFDLDNFQVDSENRVDIDASGQSQVESEAKK